MPAFVIATLALLITVAWSLGTLRQHLIVQHARELRIQHLTGTIRHLDEVLTMSARMAAATGDPKWEGRYQDHVSLLDAAIQELIALSPVAFDTEMGRETDEANQKLVAMESESFELVRAGDRDRAAEILFNGDYESQKAIYARGMEQAEAALRSIVACEDNALAFRLEMLAIASAVAMLLFTIKWIKSVRLRSREAAEATQRRIESMQAATRAKSDFLANMSHEIRTPMTAIVGYAEILTDPRQSALERANCVQVIRRNGDHLLSIVNDILDLSKIEAGKMTVEHIPCSPVQILHEVISLMQVKAAKAGLFIRTEYSFPFPRQIPSDPVRLRQVLLNLVGNSLKFTEQGGVTVAISFQPGLGKRGELRVEVRDTGIGMTSDQLAGLFQPFTQADTSVTRRFGGTGLGLSISRRLVDLLGGELSASSVPGGGSTFTLRLPTNPQADLELVHDERQIAIVSHMPPSSSAECAALHCRVLLAEDGQDNQRLICFHLRKAGVEVVVADNGRVAIDLAMAAGTLGGPPPFDLILMDMQMPEIDGYSATTVLRQRGYTRPIVALTAHAMEGDRDRCLTAGCDDYLTKPVDRSTLLGVCAQYSMPQAA
jgi:signal transduction histidine kinase